MATDLLSETVQVGSLWSNIFKVLRGKKKCQHRILYLVKSSFKNKGHFFKLERDGILLSHKKNEIMPFVAAWVKLEIIMLGELSQKEKKNTTWYHLYEKSKMWHK